MKMLSGSSCEHNQDLSQFSSHSHLLFFHLRSTIVLSCIVLIITDAPTVIFSIKQEQHN